MEALLSLSFDNTSSKDISKIRKGLRQIEGLLAQICIPPSCSQQKRRPSSSRLSGDTLLPPRQLSTLCQDPAYREFFRLQEGFEWNATQSNAIILTALDILQGVLLLHPPSRALFRRESYMDLLLDLLDAANPPVVQSQALLVLVTALLATPESTRTFEKMDGLLTIASLFKSRSTSREVKLKVVEFLYFYLMPESPSANSSSAGPQKKSSKRITTNENIAFSKTTDEKQRLLGQYLSNVNELVQDLKENAPFAF
ncbi:cell division control protein 14 [Aureobasidium sp. EXF-12298]|nr:cell division control protein 14 [Aureobasidium sp. EXF-12298]KAI4754576.1 cell division control protein 14 [Aureobasidium sp. EXF-12344]KAI4771733.1 cell division control protein 14 [Aureobasidium sp. EXF-3400]